MQDKSSEYRVLTERIEELNIIMDSAEFKNNFDYRRKILEEFFDCFWKANEIIPYSKVKQKKVKMSQKVFRESLFIMEMEAKGLVRYKAFKTKIQEKLLKTLKKKGSATNENETIIHK